MLGRNSYTRDELDQCKTAVAQQLESYKTLVDAVTATAPAKDVSAALEGFETRFFNNMTIVLDRYFVHRVRAVSGKDGNQLNEVELIVESLMNHGGVLQGNNVIKYIPERFVVKIKPGEPISLSADDFERLSAAFFDELERKFL